MHDFLNEIKAEIKQIQQATATKNDAGNLQIENSFIVLLRELLLVATGSFLRGYHVEFAIQDASDATELCTELALHDVFAHFTPPARVYVKDSQSICNLLALVGAQKSFYKLHDEIALRNVVNKSNRLTNCDTHNIARQIETAQAQIEKISELVKTNVFETLPTELQQTARERIAKPDATYQDLATALKISKSALAHRMQKLLSIELLH